MSVRITVVGIFVGIVGIAVTLIAIAGSNTSRRTARTPRALVKLVPLKHNAVVPKRVTQLQQPPVYAANATADHCSTWWKHWFETQGAAQTDQAPLIEISAPATAPVTVNRASVRVFRSYVPPAVSYVECLSGAGPTEGTLLNINLDRPFARPTIVSDTGRDQPLSFPTAVITVNRGRTEYVAATPSGRPRMYEWSITLDLVVDQRSQTVTFGSPGHPLRSWLGRLPSRRYDYDLKTQAWRPVP